jgi:hypothetical protein
MKSFILAIMCCGVGLLTAQQHPPQRMLRVSPFASVSQTVGVTEIAITYHRPGVKGREIWGKLVPYNTVWRSGANNATVFSFSDDVQINGTTLKAGKYSFFTIPGETEWKVIFNSNADQWGAYSYDSSKNVLVFAVKPEQEQHEEWLSYSFSDLTMNSAKVLLRWEKIAIPFTISTNTDANIKNYETTYKNNSAQQAAIYARYTLDTKTDIDKGLEAIDRALALNPSFGNYSVKAQLLAQKEQWSDAVKTGERAIEMGKKGNANTEAVEKMVAEWKTKLPPAKGKKK